MLTVVSAVSVLIQFGLIFETAPAIQSNLLVIAATVPLVRCFAARSPPLEPSPRGGEHRSN